MRYRVTFISAQGGCEIWWFAHRQSAMDWAIYVCKAHGDSYIECEGQGHLRVTEAA